MAALHRASSRTSYRCEQCERNHWYDSDIGREHLRARSHRQPARAPHIGRQRRSLSASPLASPRRRASRRQPAPGGPDDADAEALPAADRGSTPTGPGRERAERFLTRVTWRANTQAVGYVFDPDGFYGQLADRLVGGLPRWRRRRWGHWVCRQLRDNAHGLDPHTGALLAKRSVREALPTLGLPWYMADALGAGAGAPAGRQFGRLAVGDLSTSLRVLIPLVCPNIERCPGMLDATRTLCTPAIGERLRAIATTAGRSRP